MTCLPALLALLPFAAIAATPAVSTPLPIETFIGAEPSAAPRISPDGKHLAAATTTVHDGRKVDALGIYRLPELTVESLMPMKAPLLPLQYAWVGNTRLVVAQGSRKGSRGAVHSAGEVLAVNHDGKKQQYIYGYERLRAVPGGGNEDHGSAYIADGLPARNNRILLGSVLWEVGATDLIDVDTFNGARRTLTRVDQAHAIFVRQNDGFARFAHGRTEGGGFKLFRRENTEAPWLPVAAARTGTQLTPVAFSSDDSEFFALHSADGGPAALIAENVATGQRRVLASDPTGSITGLMWGSRRTQPFAALATTGIPVVRYLAPDTDPDVMLHRDLSRQFPGAVVEFTDASDDGGLLLFSVRSDRDPGAYYLYDRKANTAAMLFEKMAAVDPERMAPRLPITFPARDGLPIHGFLTMPPHPAGTKLPLVVIPHDGPYGQKDDWFFDADAQFLASRGYATLQVNFRGSAGRGESFRKAAFGEWRGQVIDDLADGVRWATRQHDIDGKRMCVFGTGFGAFVAMTFASREPGVFKCVVGYSGIYDLAAYQKNNLLQDVGSPEHVRRFVAGDRSAIDQLAPASHAQSITAKVLLIHGGKDDVAADSHAVRLRDALEKAGRAPEWYLEPAEGHGFTDERHQVEVYRRLEAFLARNIGK
ncbi:prolyl oligopeptidase family serine peptidase [Pseudoduganella sp. SL102]|uniref:alpha/beta hydrolase family protein n=1 Tax=Pseudoduganella sp. SL102 TaxID=2995154 RepID=UPI00248B1008|nr:prolyl oligopeptidase family serine peptidase [Pseudoduganella sp. SL102]WBS01322.1 prolyl oligopeptidase family serine peptidase [Pseudoduganella sp. SL102]